MSVQSEITRINNAVTEQTALIQEITDILEGKAGGVKPELVTANVQSGTFYYQDTESGDYKSINSGTVQVAKNSACIMSCGMVESIDIQGSYKSIAFTAGLEVFQILGDVTVSTCM